ncbi:hypothetical protein LguiA_000569 [Lonicera macranthoides]
MCYRGYRFQAAYLVKSLLKKGHTIRAFEIQVIASSPSKNVGKVGFLWELNGAKERLKESLIDPWIKGTMNVLGSCKKKGCMEASPRKWHRSSGGEPFFVVGPLLKPKPTSTLSMILSIAKDDVVGQHMLATEESKASGQLICSSKLTGQKLFGCLGTSK